MSENIETSISLCSVVISPKNQLTFLDITEQETYFSNKVKFVAENCRFQPRSEKISFNGYVDELQECNYGFYKNTYKGIEKIFYFWVVSKNYVAKEVTEITIQIDVFQTWLFEIIYRPCFIEREHVADDVFGRHTILENFELGEYITYTKKPAECLTGNPSFIIGISPYGDGELSGGIYGRTYSGYKIKHYLYADHEDLSDLISGICTNGKADAIGFIFTFPSKLLNLSSGTTLYGSEGIRQGTETLSWEEQAHNFPFKGDEYTPYNKKVYTYPYNFITVKNSSGGNVVLKLENFSDADNIEFLIESVLTQNPTISLTPKNYCGKAFAIDDSITMSDFGLCSWNNDNYANWFAQHRNSISSQSANAGAMYSAQGNVANSNYNNALGNADTQQAKGLINTGVSTANALGSMNFFGAGTNMIGGLANNALDYNQANINARNDLSNSNLLNDTNFQNTMRSLVASVSDAKVQPNTCKGSTTTSGLDMARDTATFFIEQTGIKPEYARIIDTYFQMFGYQVNRVGLPYINTREKWNYIKTVGCVVTGNIPTEDSRALGMMLDNGCTFWHDENYLYEYDTNNNIVGGE